MTQYNSFPHKLLFTNRQVENLCKAFVNYLSANIKLAKTQLSEMAQSGGFLGGFLGPLLKKRIIINENCISTIVLKCFNSIRTNCSSISSRCRNT